VGGGGGGGGRGGGGWGVGGGGGWGRGGTLEGTGEGLEVTTGQGCSSALKGLRGFKKKKKRADQDGCPANCGGKNLDWGESLGK